MCEDMNWMHMLIYGIQVVCPTCYVQKIIEIVVKVHIKSLGVTGGKTLIQQLF